MLPKIGSFPFHVESYVCDFTGRATLPVMSSFILDAASIHAQQRGFGFEEISKDNVAWVLSRLSIEIYQYPVSNQSIRVETWIENVGRFFTQRCFRFVDEEEKTLGYALSIWAAIDIATRRPVDIPSWRPDLLPFVAEDRECPIKKMEKIHSVEGVEPVMGYTVRYSDIDINRHMNSMKYIEHVVNVFDLQKFKENIISKFEIVYLQEGAFGEKLKLYRSDISENEVVIDTKRGEESVCRSRIQWKAVD
ncbi:MAG: acyl-[acyl-carrier-protein] thioesterase [Dysgonamonadaceae bacterium]|jgi:acyl-ACP thioesterase|nr:acyl-[acyl-carrier-protein] thioesterase [Dysgonamonadaceae bacterium]